MTSNFVQVKTVRDAAAMLDCVAVPQTGDPFVIPKPGEPYARLATQRAPKLKIGLVLSKLAGIAVDPEVASAVEAAGRKLAEMGHTVGPANADMGGPDAFQQWSDVVFFAFDARLDGFARRSGLKPGPDTLEPVILDIYESAKSITPARFMAALGALNVTRRKLGQFFAGYDIWLSPTTARPAEPWGKYHLSRSIAPGAHVSELFLEPIQYTVPHNIMGTPAMSLPLAMHSSGVPIGVQIAARPAQEHLLLQLASALEAVMPWRDRVPPLHVSKLASGA
jgi:amidase